MAVTVVLRGEERVSREAFVLFSFLGTLVLQSLYSKNFDIYSSFFDISACVLWMLGALSFLLASSYILRKRKSYCIMYLAPCRLTRFLDF